MYILVIKKNYPFLKFSILFKLFNLIFCRDTLLDIIFTRLLLLSSLYRDYLVPSHVNINCSDYAAGTEWKRVRRRGTTRKHACTRRMRRMETERHKYILTAFGRILMGSSLSVLCLTASSFFIAPGNMPYTPSSHLCTAFVLHEQIVHTGWLGEVLKSRGGKPALEELKDGYACWTFLAIYVQYDVREAREKFPSNALRFHEKDIVCLGKKI